MTTPQGAHVDVTGRGELLNLCANNYLGLASHPAIIAAAHEALDRWGYGMASVRFICGTQALHRELEQQLSCVSRHRRHDSLQLVLRRERRSLRSAARREGCDHLRPAEPRLDHRRRPALQGAAGFAMRTETWKSSKARLSESADARYRLIATDGVFSMDGYLAQLDRDLRPRRAARRTRDGGRLACRRSGRPRRPGHARASRRHRARRHPDRNAREGDRRRKRRLHFGAPGDRRAAAPASPSVPLLEQPRPPRRRRQHRRARADRDLAGAARPACARTPRTSAAASTERGFVIFPANTRSCP